MTQRLRIQQDDTPRLTNRFAVGVLAFSVLACACRSTQPAAPPSVEGLMLTREDVRRVSPALDKYTQDTVVGDLWKRPGLSPRDRSVVTLAALIARNQTIDMPFHVGLALDNGVKPNEISEIITHLVPHWGCSRIGRVSSPCSSSARWPCSVRPRWCSG